jgi:hypothetical protein
MHSMAIGHPPARMEPQTFGAYAPGTSLPSGSMPAAPYSHTLRAMLSMHGRRELLHMVVHSVCRTGTIGRAAPPLGRSWWAAAPSLTSLVPPRCMTLQAHSPRMTLSRLHLLRLVLTVLQMHLRTRRTTYADGLGLGREDQESARSGTGGVDTPPSVDFPYLNCFCMILFSF